MLTEERMTRMLRSARKVAKRVSDDTGRYGVSVEDAYMAALFYGIGYVRSNMLLVSDSVAVCESNGVPDIVCDIMRGKRARPVLELIKYAYEEEGVTSASGS